MRSKLFLGVALGGLAIALSAGPSWTRDTAVDPLAISAICSNEAASSGSPPKPTIVVAKPPKLLPGFGNSHIAITTRNPEAQRWFNYGLSLGRAFAHEPAKEAFAEAARLDPDCAMCVWGQAWAEGPTINYGIDGKQKAAALKLAVRAQQLAAGGPEKERLLTAALVRRYADGNGAFGDEMTALAARFPDDDEILVLAADAQMVAQGYIGTGRIKQHAIPLLETVLKRNPDHTGAIHFYIHATEWVDETAKAEPYADRLKDLAPGASHLIHMPSHTYFWIGRYRDAALANLAAIDVDEAWIKTTGWDKPDFEVPYFPHNVRFAIGGALMAGEASAGLKIADRYAAMPLDKVTSPWAQSSAGAGWAAYGRFLDPDAVLAKADYSDQKLFFLKAMRHYGRGEALARKGDAAGVRAEAAAIKPSGSKYLKVQMEIAQLVLIGRAEMLDGHYGKAAKAFRKAAQRQESVLGNHGDPPTWWYPVRRSLAAALLADGRAAPAGEEARAVLKYWIDDPMALVVLSRSEATLGREKTAAEALDKARARWSGAPVQDVKLAAI